jgi:hypothetical protein
MFNKFSLCKLYNQISKLSYTYMCELIILYLIIWNNDWN